MKWIYEQKRTIRLIYLLLLVIAINGPWGYDRINVPAEYPCTPPNIRLEGDFCGLPLSLAWSLSSVVEGLVYIVREVDLGSLRLANVIPELRVFLYLFLLLFPMISTAVLILGSRSRRWQMLHIAGLILAAGIAGLLAWLGNSTSGWILWLLWGLWLYILLTASLFALEVLGLRKGNYLSDSSTD